MAASRRTETSEQRIGLSDALFSGTRQRILGLFFGQPEKSFAISELIQLAGVGSGAVQREVQRLTESGLVLVHRSGHQKRYQANPDSPIFAELSSLVRKTMGPAEQLRVALDELGDDVELALLYGSVAKQTDRADSDIDVLLVSDTLTLEDVFRAIAPVETDLGRPVNPTLYTSKEFTERLMNENPFLTKVLAAQHIILKGSLDGTGSAGQPRPH